MMQPCAMNYPAEAQRRRGFLHFHSGFLRCLEPGFDQSDILPELERYCSAKPHKPVKK